MDLTCILSQNVCETLFKSLLSVSLSFLNCTMCESERQGRRGADSETRVSRFLLPSPFRRCSERVLRREGMLQPLPALPTLWPALGCNLCLELGQSALVWSHLPSSLQSTHLCVSNVLRRGHWEKRALGPEPLRHHLESILPRDSWWRARGENRTGY